MKLRNYQEKLLQNVKIDCRYGLRNICCVLPCGGGKTVIMAEMIKGAMEKGSNVLFLVHRKELIQQAKETFLLFGIKMKVIEGKTPIDYDDKIILSTVQTMCNRVKKMDCQTEYFVSKLKIIMVDECHHIQSASYRKIIDNTKALIFGFTATPARLDGKSLGDIFQKLEIGVSVKQLIADKYLTDFDYYLPPQKFDTNELEVKFADFSKDDMELKLDKQYIVSDFVDKWKKLAFNKKTIIYAVSIKNASNIAKTFQDNGIRAISISSETPTEMRKNLIEQFKKGIIKILVNVDLFSEGFDVPSCECVMLCRPTMSLTLFIQQAMRCMRIDKENPDKKGIIIDMVGNAYRHGLPDDDIEWSLSENIKKKRRKKEAEADIKIRTCKNCFAVFPISVNKCPICGEDYTAENKARELKKVEIELKKVEELKIKAEKIIDKKSIRNIDDLKAYAKKYGYKEGWVYIQAKLRRYIK